MHPPSNRRAGRSNGRRFDTGVGGFFQAQGQPTTAASVHAGAQHAIGGRAAHRPQPFDSRQSHRRRRIRQSVGNFAGSRARRQIAGGFDGRTPRGVSQALRQHDTRRRGRRYLGRRAAISHGLSRGHASSQRRRQIRVDLSDDLGHRRRGFLDCAFRLRDSSLFRDIQGRKQGPALDH